MSAEVPFDPRVGRFSRLSRSTTIATILTAVAALVGVAAPDPIGLVAGIAMVTVLLLAPVLRVGWFVQRWFRRGDPRYAVVGLGVLAVSAAGALLALI